MKKNTSRITALPLLMLLCAGAIKSQEASPSQWLSVNLNSFLSSEKTGYRIPETINGGTELLYDLSTTNFINPGIAFRKIKKNNWFEEYALTAISLKKQNDVLLVKEDQGITEPALGSKKRALALWLRYEYGKWFNKGQKMHYGLAFSLDPFILIDRIVPATSATFPFKAERFGAEVRFIPRIGYQISPRTLLELKVPVRLNKTYAEHTVLENPVLSEDERTENRVVSEWRAGGLQCALGLSIKL